MPTYTDMTRCDGCGECVDICPSDIMHIDPVYRRSYNIEPNFCWECYSCVKACPQNAIDVRGYADFAPLGHKVRVLREPEKGSISWKIRYRDGRLKEFTFPIRTHLLGFDQGGTALRDAGPERSQLANARARTGGAPHRRTSCTQSKGIVRWPEGPSSSIRISSS